MTLKNDNFIGFDGTPITGRTPTQLIILAPDGTELTQMQYSAICHVYKMFCDAVRVSPAEFHVQNRRLKDGTRVRLESNCGVARVMVWPSSEGGYYKLPHGFVVKTNWLDAPFIYKRVLDEDGLLVGWEPDGEPVPQAKKDILGYEQHVGKVEDSETWVIFPLVANTKTLWDYWKHKGRDATSQTVIPANLISSVTHANTHSNTVFVEEDKVRNSKGELLHTAEASSQITLDDDTVKWLPAVSTGNGYKLLIQHIRYANTAPSFGIYQFLFKGDLLTNQSYTRELVLDAVTSVSPSYLSLKPTDSNAVDTLNENDTEINEDIENDLFLAHMTRTRYATERREVFYWAPPSVRYFTWADGSVHEYTPDPSIHLYIASWGVEIEGYTYWQEGFVTSPEFLQYQSNLVKVGFDSKQQQTVFPVEKETIRFANYSGVVTCTWHSSLDYPISKRWRGGYSYVDLSPLGRPSYWDYTTGGYGKVYSYKQRRNSEYSIIGNPQVWITSWESDANKLFVFSGSVSGVLTGHYYRDDDRRIAGSIVFDGFQGGELVVPVNFPGEDPYPFPLPDTTAGAGVYEWGTNTYAYALAQSNAFTTGDTWFNDAYNNYYLDDHTFKTRLDEFVPPDNTISYDLTSRYVIDYDHRVRFWAAIVVRVVATGARWGQVAGSYRGHMEKKADASYTITISFESAWHSPLTNTVIRTNKELATAACARPMFEAQMHDIGNPYVEIDTEYNRMRFYMPKKIAPPGEAGTMFERLGTPQGANPHFVGMDWIDNTDAKNISHDGIEYSYLKSGLEIPYYKRATGMLYARKFKLAELSSALWLLYSTKCDAALNDDPWGDAWYYLPGLAETINTQEFHIELRDGVEYRWSDDIPDAPPVEDREIKLYQV